MSKFTSSGLTLIALMGLSACGGGGGSAPAPVFVPTPPTTPTVSAELKFSDITAASGVQHSSEFSASYTEDPRHFAGGAASGDIDNDGDIDLFIVRGDTQPNLLLINEAGTFTDMAAVAGVALPNGGTNNYKLSGPSFADLDGDDDLDLFIGGIGGDPSLLFRNDGGGIFSDVTAGSGLDAMTSKTHCHLPLVILIKTATWTSPWRIGARRVIASILTRRKHYGEMIVTRQA